MRVAQDNYFKIKVSVVPTLHFGSFLLCWEVKRELCFHDMQNLNIAKTSGV